MLLISNGTPRYALSIDSLVKSYQLVGRKNYYENPVFSTKVAKSESLTAVFERTAESYSLLLISTDTPRHVLSANSRGLL